MGLLRELQQHVRASLSMESRAIAPGNLFPQNSIESPKYSVNKFLSMLHMLLPGEQADMSVNTDTVYKITAAWRCIRILSETIARLPLTVYERLDNGDIREATGHHVTKLLKHSPSQFYGSFQFREAMMHHVLNTGNGIGIILRDGSMRASQIWMITEGTLDEVYIQDQKLYYKFSEIPKPVVATDVFHIVGPTKNGFTGIDPLAAHAASLGVDLGAINYAKNLWKNGAMPGAVLEYPGKASPNTQKNLTESFQKEYTGPQNAGKVILLEEGVKLTTTGWSVNDNRWPEMRKLTIEDISRIYGVPLFMLSQLDNATYDNMAHMMQMFLNDIDPWLCRWKQEIDIKLLNSNPRFYSDFDTGQLTKDTLANMVEAWQRLFNIGCLTQNEIRAKINMSKLENGDRPFVQGNNLVPVDLIDDLAAQRFAKKGKKMDAADVGTVTEKDA